MLAKRTVLVLGAGSSMDFGLPAGPGLAKQIQGMLDLRFDFGHQKSGSFAIMDAFVRNRRDEANQFADRARVVSRALPAFKSIDDCLHSHSADTLGVLAGKMAIAEAISAAEKSANSVAHLWQGDPSQRRSAKAALWSTWAGRLVSMLVTGVPRADYPHVLKDLTVVSFNYDRCFASIVFHLLQDALNLDEEQASEAMAGMTILHPYGRLGPLPFEGGHAVQFGTPGDLLQAAQRLFLYTEARDEPDYLAAIRNAVYQADRMLFLGFGFHEQNVRLMASPEEQPRGKEMFATVFGVPGPGVGAFQDRVSRHLGVTGPLRFEGMKCLDFLDYYGAELGG